MHTFLIVLSISALMLAHLVGIHLYIDYKLDQLLQRRYLVERSGNLDKLAKINDRIQFWIRVRDGIRLL